MSWTGDDMDLLIGALALCLILIVGTLLVFRIRFGPDRARAASLTGPFDPATRLSDIPVLVADLETTGLDVRRDRVVSVGAIPGHGANVNQDQALDVLVNPERRIPPRSTAIHHITDEMVKDADTFEQLFPKLNAMLTDHVVVGHNIGFDLAILRGECKRVGLDWSRPVALDVVRLAAALDPRERDLSLEGMARRWGVAVAGRHTALGDALMAAEMWARMIPRLSEAGVETLGEALIFERRARAVIANQKHAGW